MLGIKTKIRNIFRYYGKPKISNDYWVHELMTKFEADEYGHRANRESADLGYGWIHYGLIRQIKPKRVLCIGSRQGYIPAILGQACKDNGLGCVDFVDAGYGSGDENHWTGIGYWKTKQGRECFQKFGLGKYVKLFVTTTKEFKKRFPKRRYQYIYIDGDHSYTGVKNDFSYFFDTLDEGGYMVFHDVCVSGSHPEGEYGVHKLWSEISGRKGITFEFTGSGLGVLQK